MEGGEQMSNQIENRIVEMEFDNKQFEDGVKESLSTLDKLKQALNFKDAGKNLEDFGKATKNFDLNGIGEAVEKVGDKFSTFRLLGIHALANLVDAAMDAGKKMASALMTPFNQIRTGGWNRAMNIENAKFQLEGLGVAWEQISEDINYGVQDTAYGLDAAAKAASQLVASGVEFGETWGPTGNSPMAKALRGISGVAAMTNSSYDEIAHTFTRIAGQGKVMATDLNSLAARGLNAAAILANQFGTTEAEIREMVHDGQIDFEIFSTAMDDAFGEHAKEANRTFTGALENIKAALNKIGQPFATSVINGMIPIFNEIRLFLNAIRANMGPVFDVFERISQLVSNIVSSKISDLTFDLEHRFTGLDSVARALNNTFDAFGRIILAISDAFQTVFPSNGDGLSSMLNGLAEAAEAFSEKLLLDNDSLNMLRNTVVIILSVLKVFLGIIGKVLSIVGSIAKVALQLVGVLGKVIIFIGNLIYMATSLVAVFIENLNIGEKLSWLFEKLGQFADYICRSFNDTSTVLGKFVNGLKNVAMVLGAIVAGPFILIYQGVTYLYDALSNAANPIDFLKAKLAELGNKIKDFVARLKEIPVIGKVVRTLTSIFNKVSKPVTNLIKWFGDLFKRIRDGESVIDILKDKIGRLRISTLTSKLSGLAKVFDVLKKAIMGVVAIVGGTLLKAFIEVKNLVVGFAKSKDPFGFLSKSLKDMGLRLLEFINRLKEIPVIGTVISKIEAAFMAVGGAIKAAYDWFDDFAKQVQNGAGFFEVLKNKVTELASSIKNTLTTKWDEFLDKHDGFKGVIDKVKVALVTAKTAFIEFAATVKEKIATLQPSKVILFAFAAMILVCVYNINELLIALGSLTRKLSNGFWNIFKTSPTKWEKFSAGMIAIAAAIGLVAGAFVLLKDVETDKLKEIAKSLGLIIGMVAGLSLLSTVLVQFTSRYGGGDGFVTFALNMLALSTGVAVLIGALKLMETVNMEGILKRLGVLGLIAAGLMTIGIIMGRLAPKLTIGGIFMVAFSASVLVLVKALENLSKINLTGIKENWKELTAVILAFGVFALAASSVGIGSVIGLVAFLMALRYLFKNFDFIKKEIKRTKIGETLSEFANNLKKEIKAALKSIKDTYLAMSEFDKVMLAVYGLVTAGSISLVLWSVNKAAKSIGKAARSIALLIAAIAGFMALFYYISDMSKAIPIESIKQAEKILKAIGIFIIALLAVCALGSESSANIGFNFFKGKHQAAKMLSRSSMEKNVLSIKKLLSSMALLLLAVAGFMFVVGKLTPEQIKQGSMALAAVMGFVGVIAIVCTAITKSTTLIGNFSVGFSTFVGIIALMAALIGAFVVLMNYFENFDFAHRWPELAAAITGLGIVVGTIILFTRTIGKVTGGLGVAATVGAIGASVSSIGAVIVLMVTCIKPEQMEQAKEIAIMLGLFLVAMVGIAISMAFMLKSFKKVEVPAVVSLMHSVAIIFGEIIALVLVMGALAIAFQKFNIDTGTMVTQLGAITLLITALFGCVVLITELAKHGVAQENMIIANGKLLTAMEIIMGLIAAVIIFAVVAYALRNVNAGRMAAQFAILIGVVFAIAAFIVAIHNATQGMKLGGGTVADSIKNILAFEIAMAGLVAFMVILAGLMAVLGTIKQPGRAFGLIEALVLIIAELIILSIVINEFSKKLTWEDVAIGLVSIGGMVLLLWALVPMFKVFDTLKAKSSRLFGLIETLVLVLLELTILAGVFSLLAQQLDIRQVLIGYAALGLMLVAFWLLVPVFLVLDKLSSDAKTLIKKVHIIVLVLLELIAITSLLLGPLLIPMLLGGISAGAMIPLIGIFLVLSATFLIIDRLHTDGLLKKSQIIVLVLLELVGMMSIMGALVLAMFLGSISAIALAPLVAIFGILAEIFLKIQDLNVTGMTERSNEIMKCLLKLVGIAALMGLFAPLVGAASFGVPAILGLCEAMIIVAKAFQMLKDVNPSQMEAISKTLAKTLLELAGIGVIGLIGGPGLIALANGILILGEACVLAGSGIKDFSDGLVNLASLTPAKIEIMVLTIKDFFKTVGNGLITLGKSIAKTIIEIVKGAVEAVNQIKNTGPAFDYFFEVLKKFIKVCSDAGVAIMSMLIGAKAIMYLGKGIGAAGIGFKKFSEAVNEFANITPDKLENMKKSIGTFFESLAEGVKVLGTGVKEGFNAITDAISDFAKKMLTSKEAMIGFVAVVATITMSLIILSFFAPMLLGLGAAFHSLAEAISIVIDAFIKLSEMSDSQIAQMKDAIAGFFDAIVANKEGFGEMLTMLWKLLGVFSAFAAVVTIFGPGLAGFAAMVVAITAAVVALTQAISGLTANITAIANMTQEQIANMRAVIQAFFAEIITGVKNLGATIVSMVLYIGFAIGEAIGLVIVGLVQTLFGGKTDIENAAGSLGESVKTGFELKIGNPWEWGLHIVQKLASGLKDNMGLVGEAAGAIATVVGHYLKNSNDPIKGALSESGGVSQWFVHMGQKLANGLFSTVPDNEKAAAAISDAINENLGPGSKLPGNVDSMMSKISNYLGEDFSTMISQATDFVGNWNSIMSSMAGPADLNKNVTRIGQGTLYDYQQNVLNPMLKKAQAKLTNAEEQQKFIERAGRYRGGASGWELDRAQTEVDAAKNALSEIQGVYDNVGHAALGAAEGIEEANTEMEETPSAAGGAAAAMNDFESELTGVLEGQMDIFSKFEKKSAMSKSELLENMRSQIKGMTEWANDMQVLAAKGIDQGLYEKLAMMGPQGAEYVGAFKEMTAEELAEANQLWGQSLILPSTVSKQLTASYSNIGNNMMLGLQNGLTGPEAQAALEQNKANGERLVSDMQAATGVQSPSWIYELIGYYCMLGLRDGIKMGMKFPILLMKKVANTMVEDTQKILDPEIFYGIAVHLVDGLTAGLSDEDALKRLSEKLEWLAQFILSSGQKPNGIKSPSKLWRDEMGRYLVMGLAEGLEKYSPIAGEAAEDLGNFTTEKMKETIAGVAKNLLEDDEFTPVITPVLDLSNVQSGARTLNSMLTTNNALAASAALADLQNQQSDPNNITSRLGSTFIQNNYSPKALNRIEIYRQTRNQFAMYKEMMS